MISPLEVEPSSSSPSSLLKHRRQRLGCGLFLLFSTKLARISGKVAMDFWAAPDFPQKEEAVDGAARLHHAVGIDLYLHRGETVGGCHLPRRGQTRRWFPSDRHPSEGSTGLERRIFLSDLCLSFHGGNQSRLEEDTLQFLRTGSENHGGGHTEKATGVVTGDAVSGCGGGN